MLERILRTDINTNEAGGHQYFTIPSTDPTNLLTKILAGIFMSKSLLIIKKDYLKQKCFNGKEIIHDLKNILGTDSIL